MKILPVLVLLLAGVHSFAQQSVPVFANQKDSVEFYEVQAALRQAMSDQPGSRSKIDSLFRLQTDLRSKIIGYRSVFVPNESFTPLQNLENGMLHAEKVRRLSISNVNSPRLPKSVYLCPNLEAIELVNTNVRSLNKKLRRLPHLSSIYVYNNTPPGRLKLGKNSNVRELTIRGVAQTHLPRSYRKLPNLEELDLSRNIGLSEFPDIYRNRNLKKLILTENILTLSDLKDGSNTALEELHLQRNQIETVPGVIGTFSGLRKLSFNYNRITVVEAGLAKLNNLEELSFYQNKLSAVPESVYSLHNLAAIDLYYNQIEQVDQRISELDNLEILFLSNNQLRSLPESLGHLPKLKELYVHHNRLSYLPNSITQLASLRVLRLNNNYFTSFPESILNLTDLENLDVSGNNLNHFPEELVEFQHLRILSIVNNPWENRDTIVKIAELLRIRGTVVHANEFTTKKQQGPARN